MRISTSWAQQLGVNAMNAQQVKMSKTQMQLSSGLEVLTPSDDPAAAVRTLSLQETIDKTAQYQDNIGMVRSRLSIEEGGLDTAENIMFRAKELTVQALNDTLTLQDRVAIKSEIDQLLQEMVGVANTKNANGEYIFSGDLSTTPAVAWDAEVGSYVYQGGINQRVLDIAPERRVADGDLGSNVFSNIDSVSQEANVTVNGTEFNQRSVFDTLQSLSNALSQNYEVPEAVLTGDRFVRFGMDYSTPVTVPVTPSLTTTFNLTSDVGRTLEGTIPLVFPLNYNIATGGTNAVFDLVADGVSTATITLAADYADQTALVDDIQAQIDGSALAGLVEVDPTASPIQFKSVSTAVNPTLEIVESAAVTAPATNNDFVGDTNFTTPTQSGVPLTATGAVVFPVDYSVTNAVFDFDVDGNTEKITLALNYADLTALAADFLTQISGTSIDGLVEIDGLANPIQFNYLGANPVPSMTITQNSSALVPDDFLGDAGFTTGDIAEPVTVTLNANYADLDAVVAAINLDPALAAINIEARSNGNQIEFISTTEGKDSSVSIYAGTGTFLTDFGFAANETGKGADLGGSITGSNTLTFATSLDYSVTSAVFELADEAGNSQIITLDASYADNAALIKAIQDQINGSPIEGKIEIDPTANPVQFKSISSGTSAAVQINQISGDFLKDTGFVSGDTGRAFTKTANDVLADLDTALDNFLRIRTTVGARLNALDDQESQNEKFIVDMQSTLSDTRDLDYAEAISRFNIEQTALQAAQQAYSRVQNLSLFNFL